MTVIEARLCVKAVADYLQRRDESPRAARDIRQAVEVITASLRAELTRLQGEKDAAEAQLAAVTEERDTLLVTSCGTRMRARSLQRALDAQQATIQQLHGYVQHKSECKARVPRDLCRGHGGDGGINGCPVCQGVSRMPPCDCGLDAALNGFPPPPAQEPTS